HSAHGGRAGVAAPRARATRGAAGPGARAPLSRLGRETLHLAPRAGARGLERPARPRAPGADRGRYSHGGSERQRADAPGIAGRSRVVGRHAARSRASAVESELSAVLRSDARAPRLVSIATARPEHEATQSDARALVERMFRGTEAGSARLLQVFEHSGIERRRVCMPLEWYLASHAFEEQNALYLEHALKLGGAAAKAALARAGLAPADVDHVLYVSTTGIATPSLDARLSLMLGCRTDCRRTPVWGLGCAGGAAGPP